jgi:hypothetical protein
MEMLWNIFGYYFDHLQFAGTDPDPEYRRNDLLTGRNQEKLTVDRIPIFPE